MDIFEAIMTRRSIRNYTDTPISDDDLRLLLKCAMMAPSAQNEQPWHFVVARDTRKREELSHVSPYTHMAARAPVVVVVCGDLNEEKAPGMWAQDCSAAIENLMLAARAKGIGCVWCGVHPRKERETAVAKALNLPANVIPLGLVCMGHADQGFKEADRFKEDRIHHETW